MYLQSPSEKAMEADISILRKPGHFYFALTPKDERAGWISSKIGNYSWRFGDSARANVSVFAVCLELNYAAGAASTSARAGEE
jgi:hypothetical protein